MLEAEMGRREDSNADQWRGWETSGELRIEGWVRMGRVS
jgi:hypothetical protein